MIELLATCESAGTAAPYIIADGTYREQKGTGGFLAACFPEMTTPIPFRSKDEEIFVISDLHIAEGKDELGVRSGLENFFADEAFERFLTFADKTAEASAASGPYGKGKALLVINGDSFDFLRVTRVPSGDAEILAWQQELEKLKILKTPKQLVDSISPRERKYGLETDDFKTVFKLMRIRQGHPRFFAALAGWIARGHRLLMLKGNHDLEIVWPAVRNYVRLMIAETISLSANRPANQTGGTGEAIETIGTIETVLRDIVLPRIHFIDDAVLVDGTLYLEHGHRYDKFTMVLDSPFLDRKGDSGQINIPFGSFFNRYLINRVELAYPFLDKVRPSSNIIPILVRENLPLAAKVFGQQVPLLLRILRTNRRYVWFMFRRIAPIFAAALPVLLYLAWVIYHLLNKNTPTQPAKTDFFHKDILPVLTKGLGGVGSLILSYLLTRFVGWAQIVEPSSLDDYARHVLRLSGRSYPIMTMGHTHNPSACDPHATGDSKAEQGPAVFFNSGTWIPVIEVATADVRADRTYTFLHLIRDENGRLTVNPDHLQRWNDDAGRPDPQLILRPK
jgi:UDP-2,3-diacylglucosamine pyrophosphatase LpxH